MTPDHRRSEHRSQLAQAGHEHVDLRQHPGQQRRPFDIADSVARRHLGGDGFDERSEGGLVDPDRLDVSKLEMGSRDGAGLVKHERIHAAHRLERVDALDEGARPADAKRGRGVGHGDHDREALGNEGYEHGGSLREDRRGAIHFDR